MELLNLEEGSKGNTTSNLDMELKELQAELEEKDARMRELES